MQGIVFHSFCPHLGETPIPPRLGHETLFKKQREDLEQLRTLQAETARRVERMENELRTWPVQMDDLADKARHALQRLSKRIKTMEAPEPQAEAEAGEIPQTDEITARIHARRSQARGLPGQSSG